MLSSNKRWLLAVVMVMALLCIGCERGVPELSEELALDVFMGFVALFAPEDELEAAVEDAWKLGVTYTDCP